MTTKKTNDFPPIEDDQIQPEEQAQPEPAPAPAPDPVDAPAEDQGELEALVQRLEGRAKAMRNLAKAAVAMTRARHWVDMEGSPYLTASGAEWIAMGVGIPWQASRPEVYTEPDEEGRMVTTYTVEVTATLGQTGQTVTVHGAASTRDPFLGDRFDKQTGELRRAAPKENIIRKAESNGIRRAVIKLLGLGDVTWDMIESVLGPEVRQASKKAGFGGRRK